MESSGEDGILKKLFLINTVFLTMSNYGLLFVSSPRIQVCPSLLFVVDVFNIDVSLTLLWFMNLFLQRTTDQNHQGEGLPWWHHRVWNPKLKLSWLPPLIHCLVPCVLFPTTPRNSLVIAEAKIAGNSGDVLGAWCVMFTGPGMRCSWGLACDILGAWHPMFTGLACEVHRPGVRCSWGAWHAMFLGCLEYDVLRAWRTMFTVPGVRCSRCLTYDVHGSWRAMFTGPGVRCSPGLVCDVHGAWLSRSL